MEKTYLGDGAYASFDGWQIRVYTSNGVTEDNEVFLEPSTYAALQKFAKECWRTNANNSK